MSTDEIPGNDEGGEGDARLLTVEVNRIESYDRNPRHSPNPEYDRIRASIRSDGMDQPLVITQRPGDTDFVIRSGGNTRLQIVKELLQETGEPRFRTVQCVFRAWTRETDVLLAHLKENDLRGNLSFLDKSRAVLEAKQLIEQEGDGDALSQRQLVEALRSRGYHLSRILLSQMEYTVQRLLPVLPVALPTMSRREVERIRKLDTVIAELWHDMEANAQQDYDETFDTLCRRYDGPDWDIENLQHALEVELEMLGALNINQVRAELDARMSGRGSVIPVSPAERARINSELLGSEAERDSGVPQEARDPVPAERAHIDAVEQPEEIYEPPGTSAPTETWGESLSTTAEARTRDYPEAISPVPDPTPTPDPKVDDSEALMTIGTQGPVDLKSLRARCWTLAERLAQRNGLENLVQPLPGSGLGFMLTDVPDAALAETLDDDALALVSNLWWHLAACCELTCAPPQPVLPRLAEGSVLSRAMETGDANLLFDNVWTMDPGNAGWRLWWRLDDLSWRDLLNLMHGYRTLRRAAEQAGNPVWD